jgi:ribonuclease HII
LKELGVDDSKALTEGQRESLLQKLHDNDDYIGWAINILSPRHISTRYLLENCLPHRSRNKEAPITEKEAYWFNV